MALNLHIGWFIFWIILAVVAGNMISMGYEKWKTNQKNRNGIAPANGAVEPAPLEVAA